MVKIRLKRVGRTNLPEYRIVVQDARVKRAGPEIEIIGSYHPLKKKDNVIVKTERLQHWVSMGAQPTEKLSSLLKKAGVKVS